MPWMEKLQALLKTSNQNSAFRYSEHIVGQGGEMFAKSSDSELR